MCNNNTEESFFLEPQIMIEAMSQGIDCDDFALDILSPWYLELFLLVPRRFPGTSLYLQ